MKTNKFFQNNKKALVAFMSATVLSVGFTACSQDDELFESAVPKNPTELTRGGSGLTPISYVERSWDGSKVVSTVKSVNDYIELGKARDDLFRLESGKWYVVKSNYETDIILAPKGEPANLIICDGVTLKSCIGIDAGHSLNIFSQEKDCGTLISKNERLADYDAAGGPDLGYYPAIGGKDSMGKLVIHGGTITATSLDKYFSGIGGGSDGSGGDVTIYGGTIKAQGGKDAAGIGSGEEQHNDVNGGTLTVYGGTIEARGGMFGAGIGGGQDADGGKVNIYGGTVKAWGGKDAAGIGCGEQLEDDIVDGGYLTIHGGTVEARGGDHGAGIGGGQDAHGGEVIVNGGKVSAFGGTDAAGIGSGEGYTECSLDGGTLLVNGGDVFADGSGWGAGIGGGEDAKGAKVFIYGGKVVAWAGDNAGKKNGSAIGSEDGDGRRGSLTLGDNMQVHAGQNPDNARKHLFPFETRVPACFFRPYTCVEVRN